MSGEKKKMDPAITVALISGAITLLAALISSPLLLDYLKNNKATETAIVAPTPAPGTMDVATATNTAIPPMPTPGQAVLTFEQTFDNNTSGFAFEKGNWKTGKEKNNQLLEGAATNLQNDVASAVFGPTDFKDGVIEFQVKFVAIQGFYLSFRGNSTDAYALFLSPVNQNIILGYNGQSTNWQMQPFEGGNNARAFTFNQDTWYNVRLEILGTQATVWIDNNRILSSTDSRLTQGAVMFNIDGGGAVKLDNVKVWEYGQ